MSKRVYEEEALRLIKAIDIAIAAFEKFPPENFEQAHLTHIINTYSSWKNRLSNPQSQYKNLKSLQHDIENVFTYFQESSGTGVEFFWKQINHLKLGYKRENKLANIIKRKKIKNDIEYDFIIDVLLPYQQENLISAEDVNLLNDLLAKYERSHGVN